MAFSNYPFAASSTPASPTNPSLHTPIKFHPFAQSPFAVPTSSSFNAVADNSISEMTSSKMLGVQVKPWVDEKIHDEGLDDLELTLGTGKGKI
jgi:brassinosteroid resistant 1/2